MMSTVRSKIESIARVSWDEGDLIKADIIKMGKTAVPCLIDIALEFDPNRVKDDPTEEKRRNAQNAIFLIGEIGILNEEQSRKLYNRFVHNRTGGEAMNNNWGGVWGDCCEVLCKLGYLRMEQS